MTELEQYFHTACCMSKYRRHACRVEDCERTFSEKSTIPTLDRTKLGARKQGAMERERVLKDKAGSSLVLAIADNGSFSSG